MKKVIEKPAPKRKSGRPREFVRSEAVSEAMKLFWDHGYEGATFGDLVTAMDLNPSSFYSAFGSKQQLYFETVESYISGPGDYISTALNSDMSARNTVAAILDDGATACTADGLPPGCMVALAAMHVGPAHAAIREAMTDTRKTMDKALAERLGRAISEGELAQGTDVELLAAYFATVFRGMAAQARDGANRETLRTIGRMAMEIWPKGGQPRLRS